MLEFASSLGLEPSFMSLLQRKKNKLGHYVYFFEIEVRFTEKGDVEMQWQ